MKSIFFLLFSGLLYLGSPNISIAQSDTSKHFLYKAPTFSPPIQAMIRQFEGFPCTPIQARDIDSIKHEVGGYRGKLTILFFWNTKSSTSLELIPSLNALLEKHSTKVKVLSFADELKSELRDFRLTQTIDFPIIPNSKMLGDAVYATELGYPRIFVLDEFGIIQLVMPEILLTDNTDIERMLQFYLH